MKRYITLHGVNEGDLCYYNKYDAIESYKKMNELFNRRQDMEFRVMSSTIGFWISTDGIRFQSYYLFHDETIRTCAIGNYSNRFEAGWWKTKEEAEQFLKDWLPQKNWITKEQVKAASKYSDEMAHACSINHWKQIIVAGVDEYQKALAEGKVGLGCGHCALCQKHKNKYSVCTLKGKKCVSDCISTWIKARNDLWSNKIDGAIELYNKLVETYNKNFRITDVIPEFSTKTIGEVKMDNLDSKIAQVSKDIKLLQDEKKKLKVERKQYTFQKGDLVMNGGGFKRLIACVKGDLVSIDKWGEIQSEGQIQFIRHDYEKIGIGHEIL